ncbi:vesicular-fusion protein S17 [Podila verticillata]|nr:vesicular-fusion protein S17 [Podila verticillata]
MTVSDPQELLSQAEKKANSATYWFMGNKYEEAADLYTQAANQFRQSKRWKESGDCLVKAADMYEKEDEPDQATSSLIDASKSYRKCSLGDAIHVLSRVVILLTSKGRFQQAAGYQKEIGELYEADEVGNLRKAMESYEIAAEWYTTEGAIKLAHGCLLKEVALAGELKEYAIAIKQLELVARASADSQLLKWSLKEYLLKAGLCHLATNDLVSARNALTRYNEMDALFLTTKEGRFLQNLLKDVEGGDVARFTEHIVEFDRYSKLDGWKTKILLGIKGSIGENIRLL